MEGIDFGWLMNALAEPEPLSGPSGGTGVNMSEEHQALTPADIAAELERVAVGTLLACVLVLLGEELLPVALGDALLEDLTELMQDGGRPIGILLGRADPAGGLDIRFHRFREYGEDERIEQLVIAFLSRIGPGKIDTTPPGSDSPYTLP